MRFEPRRSSLGGFGDAFRGIGLALREERHMRIHLAALCAVLWLALRLGLSRGELAALLATCGAVMAAEALNSALERLCDYAEPRYSVKIRAVKDLAAGAVLLCALAAVGVGLALFLRPETWALLLAVLRDPLRCGLAVLFLAAALAFVFGLPGRNKKRMK